MGENDNQQGPKVPPDKSFELLTQSVTSYHLVDKFNWVGREANEQPSIREEKPYGYEKGSVDSSEYSRIYLKDIVKVGPGFEPDLILEFDGWDVRYKKSFLPSISIEINNKTLVPELREYTKEINGKNRTRIRYRFTILASPNKEDIKTVSLKEAIEHGYIRRQFGIFPNKIECYISFQLKNKLIKNVASFSIFHQDYYEELTEFDKISRISDPIFTMIPKVQSYNNDGTVIYNEKSEPASEEARHLLINLIPNFKSGYEDPPYGHRINWLQGGGFRFHGDQKKDWAKQTENNILIKFFDVDLTDPHPDDHYREILDIFPGIYDCCFIEVTGVTEDTTVWGIKTKSLSFRLVDPQSLPKKTVETKLNGQTIRETFFQLSNENFPKYRDYPQQFIEYAKKFYVMLPMDEGEVRGIKIRQFTPQGNAVDSVTAIANTNGVQITLEPQKIFPSWKNGDQLKPGVKFDQENNIYTKVEGRNELSIYYAKEQVMLHKQINTTCGKIYNGHAIVKATDAYIIEATSNYYCTIIECKPQGKYIYDDNLDIKGITFNVWDSIKHVVKNRIGWTNASYFLVMNVTVGQDVKKVVKDFQPSTLWSSPDYIKDEKGQWCDNEKGELRELTSGLLYGVGGSEMWGIDRLNPVVGLNGLNTPNRTQVKLGQGNIAVVVRAVKGKRTEDHLIIVRGEPMKNWGRPFNY